MLVAVRESFERVRSGHSPDWIEETAKPEKSSPLTEEEFWESLRKHASDEYENIRQLIDMYRRRSDIELDPMKMGLLVRLGIRGTDRQATIFLAQRSGKLGVWPGTVAGQLRGAGVDPSPAERYDTEMRRILKMPKHRKEFYRSLSELDIEEFKSAVDALIDEIQEE